MKLELFDYHLPKERIAQSSLKPRDRSRLLVYERSSRKTTHDHFYNLGKYLRPGDVLVFNDTKVFPARLFGRKITGGRTEVFLLKPVKNKAWEVLIGGKVRRVGLMIYFSKGLKCQVIKKQGDGIWRVRFNKTPAQVLSLANKIGTTPTPPYVKKLAKLSDYQTVYAKNVGSVAAPTAGFHFTKSLLAKLKKLGIQFEYVTLHVGLGTFQPVKVDDIKEHKMHEEYAAVDKRTVQRLLKAKREGRRIIAVGTTSVRVLEAVFSQRSGRSEPSLRPSGAAKRGLGSNPQDGFSDWINIFIYPGYKFKMVDAMITNFHLPKSTLLMLVAAFLARRGQGTSPTRAVEQLKNIYKKAIQKKYRFYSFGDGMLIR